MTLPSSANSWYFPLTESEMKLAVLNRANHDVTFWLANPQDNSPGAKEISFTVKRKSLLPIHDLTAFSGSTWLQLKSYEQLPFHLSINGSLAMPGRSSRIQARVPTSHSQWHLTIANLVPIHQEGVILFSQPGKNPLPLSMAPLAKKELVLSLDAGEILKIQFEYPITALVWNDQVKPRAVAFDLLPSNNPWPLSRIGAHFLLRSQSLYSDSFIVHLTDPEHIQQARKQISHPDILLPRILSAYVSLGHQQHNQNWISPEKSPWSWHVSQVNGFYDVGSHSCDGNPQILEDYLLPWLSFNKPICFWNYQIVQELTSD